jgi:hypothetical protein
VFPSLNQPRSASERRRWQLYGFGVDRRFRLIRHSESHRSDAIGQNVETRYVEDEPSPGFGVRANVG